MPPVSQTRASDGGRYKRRLETGGGDKDLLHGANRRHERSEVPVIADSGIEPANRTAAIR